MRCKLRLTYEEWGRNQRRGDLSKNTPPHITKVAALDHYPKWEGKTLYHSLSSFPQATERGLSKRQEEFWAKPLCGHWNWHLVLQANPSSMTLHKAMKLPFNSAYDFWPFHLLTEITLLWPLKNLFSSPVWMCSFLINTLFLCQYSSYAWIAGGAFAPVWHWHLSWNTRRWSHPLSTLILLRYISQSLLISHCRPPVAFPFWSTLNSPFWELVRITHSISKDAPSWVISNGDLNSSKPDIKAEGFPVRAGNISKLWQT